MADKCLLPEFKRCCCTCAHRVNDWSHPCTDGGRILHRRGYICSNPELGNYSGWSQHGLCEVYDKRPVATAIDREFWDNLYGERVERPAASEEGEEP
jgi:hypothetical protein